LVSLRQHELIEAADTLNAQLQEEIAERKRAEALLSFQKQAWKMVARGEPVERMLDFLARSMESQSRGEFLVAIHLLEEDGHHFGYWPRPACRRDTHRRPGEWTPVCKWPVQRGRGGAQADSSPRFRGGDALARVSPPRFLSLGLAHVFTTPIISSDPESSGHSCHLLP